MPSSLFNFLLFIYLFSFFLSNLRLDHPKCIIPTIIRIISLKTPQLNFPCTILDSCTIAIYSECEFHLVVIPLLLFLVRDGAPLLLQHSPAWWRTNVQIWAWCCHLQIKRRPKKNFTNPSTLVPYRPWWLSTSPSPKLPITWFVLRIVPNIVIESVTIVVSCYSSRDNTLRASHRRLHYVFWMKNNQV